jgi:hypothetical protein
MSSSESELNVTPEAARLVAGLIIIITTKSDL